MITRSPRTVRLFLLVAVLLALAWWPAARIQAQDAAPAAVALDEYAAALEAAQGDLSGGDAASLARARERLAVYDRLTLPSGAEITLSPLLGAEGDDLTPAAAEGRVRTLLAQLESAGRDETTARLAVLEQVLAGPAFGAGESWWDIVRRWLAEWLDRLLPNPAPVAGASQTVEGAVDFATWLLGGIGVLALFLLLVFWLRGLIRNFVADATVDAPGAAGDDLPQTPGAARRLAAGAANSGDYRSAVRNLYLSALLTLEQHGLVPADRSLTNREVLARVDRTHPLRPRLEPVVATFDDVWYGVHEPDAATYAAYTQSIDELESLAAAAEAGAGAPGRAPAAPAHPPQREDAP
jgi:hypothetical protein